MFDLGFLELVIVAVIALLILGPERLPGAARAAGQWVGRARRLTRQFTDELDRQVKADEIREQLRREKSAVSYEDIQKNVQEALDAAKKDEDLILPEPRPRRSAEGTDSSSEPSPGRDADDSSGPADPDRDMPDDWRSNIPSDRRDS